MAITYGEGFDEFVKTSTDLDKSNANRTNITYSRLAQQVAVHLLTKSSLKDLGDKEKLEALEKTYKDLATEWTTSATKPGFSIVEGVKYAINALKFSMIQDEGHVVLSVPFFKEFERGADASDDNPNGEASPIQKFEELVFLCKYNSKVSITIIFVNDALAEKKDENPSSVTLFKESIAKFAESSGLVEKQSAEFETLSVLDGQLTVQFTSVEAEVAKGSACETPEEKRKRMENRSEAGKLQERKGGAVLTGMEIALGKGFDAKPTRALRILLDGDSTIGVGAFVGEAAYSILQSGSTCYLANMKDALTCISYQPAEEGAPVDDSATQARVQNRKLFFSGFTVPFLFPEILSKYKYKGTTQLPAKAFRGDIDFMKAKLPTVQPNVDLGCLALTVSYLNANGGSIESGPITIKDNVASSTMTTSDLKAEWDKTYGPIFVSAVGLCRTLKPTDFAALPGWLTTFIESMKLIHYTTLFGDPNPDVDALFTTMKKFKESSGADRDAVLEGIKADLKKLFPSDIA